MTELLASTRARVPMSPHILLISICKLTQLGMVRKTPLNRSLPGSVPFYSGPAATLSTCKIKLKTLTTGGWLRRSPASVSLTRKSQNLPCELKSCTKSLMQLVIPGLCSRSGLFSPGHLKRLPGSRISQERLPCHTHTYS